VTTILCPIDFSEAGDVAQAHAEALARRLGATLLLAHVCQPALVPVALGPLPVALETIHSETTRRAQTELEARAARLDEGPIACRPLLLEGDPSARILDAVDEHDVDLVVMGTKGLTGLDHVLMGSTAERVVRLCPCPVLTVKGKAPEAGATP